MKNMHTDIRVKRVKSQKKITDIISSTNNLPTEMDEDSFWPIYKI